MATSAVPVPDGVTATADARRRVPRTDLTLAHPRLVDLARTVGAATVRAAVHRAQELVRAGQIAPDELVPKFAVAVAPLPPPPEIVTAGAEVKPEPALVKFTPITLLPEGKEQLL